MKKDQQTRNRFVELRAQGWSYERIAKELGVSKQTGNVLEWVADWYDGDYYQNAPSRNPKGPDSGTQRVLRGGSWYNYPGPCARPTAATTVRRIASAASVFVVPSEFLRILISVFCFLWSGEGL